MCGIAGAIWTDPVRAVAAPTLDAMVSALAHRGPDDCGNWFSHGDSHDVNAGEPGVALGHRRLSVIDVLHSRQPLANEDGSVQVVFNGEVYNFRDLRRRLEGNGHVFSTAGDAETIVHLYEDEGDDFVDHLVGMFALALWDGRRRRLLLARDRLGQKPLVYREEPGRLLFASELKSILEVPGVPRQVDASALDEYLTYQYVPYPKTIFQGIHKLPPGHLAVYERGSCSIRPYWWPDLQREDRVSEDDWVEHLRAQLSEAVKLRLQSDVPLGAFLSGGVDSSIMVALMSQQGTNRPTTFSIGFPVPEYDETKFAVRVAEHVGTDHHQLRVESAALDLLPQLVWHYDEPFGDSSALPTFLLSQLTRQHVTVAISGDGGDELFAGYLRYRAMRLAALVDRSPRWLRSGMVAIGRSLPRSGRQKSRWRQWRRFAEIIQLAASRRYGELISIFNEGRRAQLYSDDFLATLPDSDPYDFLDGIFARCRQRDIVSSASLVDMFTYLPCDLCHKVDIASMAHGLECRQPFLDHRVVELAMRMPVSLKMRGLQGKRILRSAFGELLPAEVFQRAKMGFGVPLDHWFRGDLEQHARDVLCDSRTNARGYFDPATVRQLLDEHQQGIFDHSARIWSLLVLETWHRTWMDA